MIIKQYNTDLHPYIQTDGCLFMSLLDIACDYCKAKCQPALKSELTIAEVNKIYWYAIPQFMQDGRQAQQNRCYILNHAEIIRLGFYILGKRNMFIQYLYRDDFDPSKSFGEIKGCNYFITEIQLPTFNHFYRSDADGNVLYNPGRSFSNNIESTRGYKIE
jgi:hypothetical protein